MRLSSGGRIDRSRLVRFTFDGTEFTGHPGDTLASALLACGHREVARSIYRDRPRGVLTADCTEPNAFAQIGGDPMVAATTLPIHDGLDARSLAGVGRLTGAEAPECDRKYAHFDVAVVGGGPAGVATALAAGRGGARVLLVEQDDELGGDRAADWISRAVAELAELPETRVLRGATAIGHYDHGYLLVAQGTRMWHVRTTRLVLATGAHERPLVFAGNDRPGIMLASAVRTYLNRFAVLPGRDAVVATTEDSAYATATALAAAGCRVHAVVDTRPEPPRHLVDGARELGARVHTGAVAATTGEHLESVRLSTGEEIGCDLLAVGGGWSPVLHLFGGELRWNGSAFLPVHGTGPPVVGAAAGTFDLPGCLAEGVAAGIEAAREVGFPAEPPRLPDLPPEPVAAPRPQWLTPHGDWREHFVDLQRDATVADIRRAVGAGMRSVEHIKRYTTIGTGSDQGKTSSVNAIGVLAELLGNTPGDVGTTAARPPYVPVPAALWAGRERGALHDPVRTTPMHAQHVAAGAVFEDVGQWKRPRYYPLPGEDMAAAVHRECLAARTGVAAQDVSTLGRIEVVGPDAPEFLNRVYTGGFAKLAVGKGRYGIMCTTDGMVFDDGVALRLATDRYLVSTTTGGAAGVLDWLEEWLQTEWTDLDVTLTSVTEQWAAVAVSGPGSRDVVARLAPQLDVSAAEFGFLQLRETVLRNGIEARICRISFSGELAYEINVASWYGPALWDAVLETGATPYGTETMHVLRAEKGFVIVGQDTDGTVTPYDLGMDWAVSRRKDFFLGRRSFDRADTARADRKQLVGLLPEDPAELLPEGAHLVSEEGGPLGHVTSSYRSAILSRTFALALLSGGRERHGQVLDVPLGSRVVPVRVSEPVFYDPEGARRDGAR
ncbi:2Fe-2S iron-sulfur cluster-binding protein [Saccharopolyspora halophila]|uniref:2Fe-2S iron-sulfur cluster-binding protein n=1 Tax=Saccharopolyspora halophila TaxID=405551 RepID=A0ABN3G8Z4_9PSEU